jgi:hypothetical protein
MGFLCLGEFTRFTLFCEEKYFGGIYFEEFLEVWAGSHVGPLRRGDH